MKGFTPHVGAATERLLHQPGPGAVVLLSDLHLDWQPAEKLHRLADLLTGPFCDMQALLLVGDLADDPGPAATRQKLAAHARPFFAALAALAKRGVAIHYIPGNHDGHYRQSPFDWAELPARCHGGDTPVRLSFFGKTLRLSHGDEYDPIMQTGAADDIAQAAFSDGLKPVLEAFYGAERRFFRALGGAPARALYPVAQQLSEHLEWLGRLSETPLPNPMFFMWRWELAARQLITRENADAVVMGHNHAPTLLDCGDGLYLNTGDWLQHATISWLDDWGAWQQDLSRPACFRSQSWPQG